MTVKIELNPTYLSDATKADGFRITITEGNGQFSCKLSFSDGLELLSQLTDAASKYRNAIQTNLEIVSTLASIEAIRE